MVVRTRVCGTGKLAVGLSRCLARAKAARAGGEARARGLEARAGALAARLLRRLAVLSDRLCRRFAEYARRVGLDADDLRQEAFLAVLRAMPSFSPRRGRSVEAYLHTVLRNHFIGLGRRRTPAVVADVAPGLMAREAEESGRQRLRLEVNDVINSLLPEDPQRAFKIRLFRLYHLESWTFQELADEHEISLASAFKHVAQVRSAFEAAWTREPERQRP